MLNLIANGLEHGWTLCLGDAEQSASARRPEGVGSPGTSPPPIPLAYRSIMIAERVVHVAQEARAGCDALWGGPFRIEIGQRIGGEDFLLALSGIEQFLHPVARRDQHVVEFLEVGLGGDRAVAWRDLSAVVNRLKECFGGKDHALDGAAAAPVEVGIG